MMNLLETWRERRRIHQTRRQLYALSDQILTDIGLTRDEISRVGHEGMPHRHAGTSGSQS